MHNIIPQRLLPQPFDNEEKTHQISGDTEEEEVTLDLQIEGLLAQEDQTIPLKPGVPIQQTSTPGEDYPLQVPPPEAEGEVGSSDLMVGGRLMAFAPAWANASKWQRKVVSDGPYCTICLPILSKPLKRNSTKN